jgi:hypothetical protein
MISKSNARLIHPCMLSPYLSFRIASSLTSRRLRFVPSSCLAAVAGTNNAEAQPSEENSMKYFINTQNWAQQENIELFYFSSFDESWKVRHEGDVGQRWGIWDKNENLKYK